MSYVPDSLLEKIEQLKKTWKYEEALSLVNKILVNDPYNDQALLQVADIEYMKWEISRAEKPIDFMLKWKAKDDPMWLYVKWVLEMEKTNWIEAKKYFRMALEKSNSDNPEIIRCYWLSEYWLWNREKWIAYLNQAFEINKLDAEIIYNLVEIYLLEHRYSEWKKLIEYYIKNRSNLETYGNNISHYDQKINLFQQYLNN